MRILKSAMAWNKFEYFGTDEKLGGRSTCPLILVVLKLKCPLCIKNPNCQLNLNRSSGYHIMCRGDIKSLCS